MRRSPRLESSRLLLGDSDRVFISRSQFDPKRTFTSSLLKRRNRVNLVKHLQHDGVGCRLAVERDR